MNVTLPIKYDRKIKLGSIGDDPVNFFMLNKFFDDFLMITPQTQSWLEELDLPISRQAIIASKTNAGLNNLIRSKKFAEFVKTQGRRKYILYTPMAPPYKVNPLVYLMNSPTIAHAFENKRYFRDEFSDLIRMPEYVIRHLGELDKAASYVDLKEEFGSFVLQDEESSGSKGTFMIHTHEDYLAAVRALKKYSQGRSVVVSKYVKGETCSIQVCITKYGVFTGGIQRQLVASKYLCDPQSEGGTKWCGGELGAEYPEFVQHQAREIASVVGSELSSHGYKGIFGVDVIITPDDNVYAIEINARLTGYSFLISDMQLKEKRIPFLLLHLLEMGNYEYEVTDSDALPASWSYKRPVSYMIINNPTAEELIVTTDIAPGIYTITEKGLEFKKAAHSLTQLTTKNEVLILSRFSKGDTVGGSKRILKIIRLGASMKNGDLNKDNQELVQKVKKHFELA